MKDKYLLLPATKGTLQSGGISLLPDTRSGMMPLRMAHNYKTILQSAMMKDLRLRCQAQLIGNTLDRIGQLSAKETALAQMNPRAAGRYQAIMDAYTLSVMEQLFGGDN